MPSRSQDASLEYKLEEQRKRLLDLGGRSKLINYKHSTSSSRSKKQSFLRIVDEIPELIIEKLDKEGSFQLVAKPEDAEYEVDLKLLAEAGKLSKQHSDNKIQVLEEEPVFSLSCEKLRTENRLSLQEKGINTLNIAIGFLHWFESKGIRSKEERYSPLLLLPVQISRSKSRTGYQYSIDGSEDDIALNTSLWLKLRNDEGLDLPEFELDDDGQPMLSEFFAGIKDILSDKNKEDRGEDWELKQWATIGLFSFGNIAIYNDLDFSNWSVNPLEQNEFLSHFVNGTPCNSISEMGDLDTEQDQEESGIEAIDVPKLIADADSTQYAVIQKAIEGKSLVVQGPPGTGKSQTITNMVSCLLDKGKRILFAADKLAALEVVKNRLEDKGLGNFCFEVHSTGSSKLKIHQEIKQRLEHSEHNYSSQTFSNSFEKLKALRNDLNQHATLVNEERQTSFGQSSIHEAIWRSVSNRILSSSSLEINAYQKAESIDLDVVEISQIDLIGDSLEQLSEKSLVLKESGIDSILQVSGIPGTESGFDRLSDASNGVRTALTDIRNECKRIGVSYNRLGELDLSFLKNQKDLISQLSTAHRVSASTGVNSNFSDQLADILGFVKARESRQQHVPDWTYPLLKDGQKFSQLLDCLDSINDLVKEEKGFVSVEEFARSLKSVFEFCRSVGRLIARESRELAGSILYSEIVAYRKFLIESKSDKFGTYGEILNACKSAQEVHQCCKAIDQINRNTKLSEELSAQGVLPSRLTEIGANKFHEAAEAIRMSKPLGCLLDKQVRVAKGIWKSCKHLESKRPPLKKLAIIYVQCAEYIERIEKEHLLTSLALDLEDLRRIATEYDLDKQGSLLLSELLEATQNTNDHTKLLGILSSVSPEIDPPKLSFVSGLSLEEVERVSGENDTLISTKTGLLGAGCGAQLLQSDPYDLDLLARDLEGYRKSITGLTNCLLEADVFDGKDLEFTLSTQDIQALFDTYNQLKISEYPGLLSSNLGNEGIESTVKLFDSLIKLIGGRDQLNLELSKEPLKSLIASNFESENLLEKEEDVSHLENVFNIISLASKSKAQVLDCLRIKNSLREKGFEKGVGELVSLSLETGVTPKKLLAAAIAGIQSADLDLEKSISTLSGEGIESLRRSFVDVDQLFISECSRALSHLLVEKTDECLLPGNDSGSPKSFTEAPLLLHEMKKQRRHLPTRLLIEQAFHTLSGLKPCWMMSPASAAQLLPKTPDLFDVLIIDEASQMKPEQAFSLIARCKQLVIVGDRNQLPPTNFFQKRDSMDNEDEEVEIEDNESVLELADKVITKNSCSLGWHYRSRHQSLINFSNYYFYDNRLTVFASNKVDSEVKYIKVEEPRYSGGVNLPEVEHTIKVLKQQVAEDPSKSILIATMNQAQTSELTLALDREIQNDPVLERYASSFKSTLDELDVKNLENVQGDERDVVIVSTVYGPGSDGRVMQNFGPINKESGWRRLNVLFTRAKHRVIVVSSLNPSDITIANTENAKRGVKAFRNYLEYAQTGKISDALRRESGVVESPFEESVRAALVRLGHQVDLQVGVASYRLDMAVLDPRDPSRYLLAIECDGASYHSSYSARSRDRLRQQVLEGLGWSIYRIWSTDWFRDPKGELQRLDHHIKGLVCS